MSVDESSSEMMVLGLADLFRWNSLVILDGSAKATWVRVGGGSLPGVLGGGVLANLLLDVLDVALVYA